MENNPLNTPPIEGTPPATPPVTPPVEGVPPVTPPSGLPSDAGDAIPDNVLAPDGQKFGGKFESTQAMLNHIKDMEDKYANSQRDLANNPPADVTPPANTPPNEQVVAQEALINDDLMPEFLKNGMIITPEMEAKAVAVGIDARDLKLGAYEMKENLQKSFAITGTQENYTAMIEWGKANLNDAQKADFDRAGKTGMGEYAVKGLWADFQKADGNTNPSGRITGDPSPKGLQPYENRKDLYADKDYIESSAGRRDKAAIDKYRARLRLTPNSVLGI